MTKLKSLFLDIEIMSTQYLHINKQFLPVQIIKNEYLAFVIHTIVKDARLLVHCRSKINLRLRLFNKNQFNLIKVAIKLQLS